MLSDNGISDCGSK